MSDPQATPKRQAPDNQSPVNPVPPVIVALFLLIAGIEAAFSLGERNLIGGPTAVGWRLAAVQDYAFARPIMDWMLVTGSWPLEHTMRFVTYPFVHASFSHTLFACVMLLALGKMVAEVIGGVQALIVFVVSGITGALAYGLLSAGSAPLLGAFPPVYGLIGAYTYLMWLMLASMGEQQLRAFSLIGILMALQLFFGVFFGNGGQDWIADIAAFVCGFGLSTILVPGGLRALLARIRRD